MKSISRAFAAFLVFYGKMAHGDPNASSRNIGHYLLQSSGTQWTADDTEAVARAGGNIFLSHAPTGLALVISNSADFLDVVKNLGSFNFAEEDVLLEFDRPVESDKTFDAEDVTPDDTFDAEDVTPDDETYFGYQWNMLAIEAPGAWEAGCDGDGARVAVIDGGIDDSHPDIAPNLDIDCSFSTFPGFGFNEDVSRDHATHVAGIVAAADNSFGVIGVAPSATLMHVKALHDNTGSFASVIMAILFASDPELFEPGCTQRADIINMSLGGAWPKRIANGLHSLVLEAMNFAASKGVLVISAAGNDGMHFGSRETRDMVKVPGTLGSGIAVSATGPVGFADGETNFRRVASYTDYGESLVDVAGPGGDFVNWPDGLWYLDMVLSTIDGGWSWKAGTSMAAPAVAGVAALIKGANPTISLEKLKAKLLQTADDEGKRGKDKFYGHGFVNAYRACTE